MPNAIQLLAQVFGKKTPNYRYRDSCGLCKYSRITGYNRGICTHKDHPDVEIHLEMVCDDYDDPVR